MYCYSSLPPNPHFDLLDKLTNGRSGIHTLKVPQTHHGILMKLPYILPHIALPITRTYSENEKKKREKVQQKNKI